MGFIDNKYVSKFISGGAPPAEFRQQSTAPESSTAQEPSSRTYSPSLPPGWVQQWDASCQRWYYMEQATGLTQWDPPFNPSSSATPAHNESNYDGASMMSGTTAHTTTPLVNNTQSPQVSPAIANAHKYTNMPTAAERDAIWAKERARREKEGDHPKKQSLGRKIRDYPGNVVNFGGLAG